jgi:hypothetical protein
MSTPLHFDTPFSFEKSVRILKDLSAALLGANHELVELAERRDWVALVDKTSVYPEIASPAEVIAERQVLAFFQKNESLPLGVDRSGVALAKFIEAEELCRLTNLKFLGSWSRADKTVLDVALIFRVQQKIQQILGEVPSLHDLDFGFGPGANVGLSRLTSTRRILSAQPTCTANAWRYLPFLQEEFPHWERLKHAKPQLHGKLTFVPKNAKTDRSIVVEPLVNTFLQKGIGSYIRGRLRVAGCDLNDQSHNQKLARTGSLTGDFATIDLSSASDTISREVVAAVLPPEWWELLDNTRTPYVRLPNGKVIYLEKFSSMGNGFTFELESLIFYAIAKVVCPRSSIVSVYGDDIIVPTASYPSVVAALEMFGFRVNPSKSFASGPFRESCGKDFFSGIDVRPCYVKGRLSVKELFRLHNFFVRGWYDDLASLVLRYIPRRFRIYGPDGFGDGHLLGDHPRLIHNRKRGWSGYTFRTYTTKPFRRCEPLMGDYAAFLFLNRNGAPDGTIPSDTMYQERSSQPVYRLSRVYTLG